MKKLLCLFLLSLFSLMHLCSETDSYVIKSFYTYNDKLQAYELPYEVFKKDNYINTHNCLKTTWVQLEIRKRMDMSNYEYLCLGSEPITLAEVYYRNNSNIWVSLGSIGTSIRNHKNYIIPWYSTLHMPISQFENNTENVIVLRMKVHSKYPGLFTCNFKNFYTMAHDGTIISTMYGLAYGFIVVTMIFLLFVGFTFKDQTSLFIAGIIEFLCLSIILQTGVFDIPALESMFASQKINYFLLNGLIYTAILMLHRINKNRYEKFPTGLLTISNFSYFYLIIILAVGIVFLNLSMRTPYTQLFIIVSTFVLTGFFVVQSICTLRFNETISHTVLYGWLVALVLLFIKHFFKSVRFMPFATPSFRYFDNDGAWTEVIVISIFVLTSIPRIKKIVQTKLDSMIINTNDAMDHINNERKRSFTYMQLASFMIDPIQVFQTTVGNLPQTIPQKDALLIRTNLNHLVQFIKSLTLITNYDYDPESVEIENEPIDIRSFIEESLNQEINSFKFKECLVDIQNQIPFETIVQADKTLLSVLFKFIIQAVSNIVIRSTPIIISTQYENCTFFFSIHFFSTPLSRDDINTLLDMKDLNDFDKIRDSLIKKWGIQLYIAKQFLDLLKGAMDITADSDGNTISIRAMLSPSLENRISDPLYEDDSEIYEEDYNTNLKPIYNETIFVLEENSEIRKLINTLLSPFYKVISVPNGDLLKEAIKIHHPDLIIASLTISGKNPFTLLEERIIDSHIPLFITAKNTTKVAVSKLYALGVVEVIQKPFDGNLLVYKVNALLRTRRDFAQSILTNITNTLHDSVFLKKSFSPITYSIPTPNIAPNASSESPSIKYEANTNTSNNIEQKNSQSTLKAIFNSANLTERQIDVALLIAENLSDKEIAQRLGISPQTVAVNNKKIFSKLGIHSRKEIFSLTQN